jgi:hypothetical protein
MPLLKAKQSDQTKSALPEAFEQAGIGDHLDDDRG